MGEVGCRGCDAGGNVTLTETVRVPAQVMARVIDGETVILDLAGGMYFGLDAVGTRIWGLLGEGWTLGEVCEVMVGEYEVTREVVEGDVVRLVGELAAKGLLEVGGV